MKYLKIALIIAIFTLPSCNKCKNVICENGGTCINGECDCPDDFQPLEMTPICFFQNEKVLTTQLKKMSHSKNELKSFNYNSNPSFASFRSN